LFFPFCELILVMKRIKNIVLIIVIVTALFATVKIWRLGKIAFSLRNTLYHVQEIADDPSKINPRDLQPIMHQTYLDLIALQSELEPFDGIMTRLGWLPVIGGDVANAPALLGMGVSLAGIGDVSLTAFNPLLITLEKQTNKNLEEILPLVVEHLAQSRFAFQQAQQHLQNAIHYRQQINADHLSPFIAKQISRLDKGLPFLELALDMAPIAPDILGVTERRNYLLIAQNDDELRATGGFMSSVGKLILDKGNVITITFQDGYDVYNKKYAYPDPPSQLQRYMLSDIWVFRDANWYPDFPTSAYIMQELYHISRVDPVHGIIAVDQVALQRFVTALQPLHVPKWDEPVTGKNVIQLIRESWAPDLESIEDWEEKKWNREWWEKRKSFTSDLVKAMRQKIQENPQKINWQAFLEATISVLDERHVQVWFANETAQAMMRGRQWDGAIRTEDGDYLMITQSNLGFNKANAVVDTDIIYDVDLTQPAHPTATLTIAHKNNSKGTEPCNHKSRYGVDGTYSNLINRCYWEYLRIYTPPDTELLQAITTPIPGNFLISHEDNPAFVEVLPHEVNKSVWGTFLMVGHGETKETMFKYELSNNSLKQTESGWRYNLTAQKQAGTRGNKMHVSVKLPLKHVLVSVIPSPKNITDMGHVEFDLVLKTDEMIEIVFR